MFASTYSSGVRGGGARKTANTSGAGGGSDGSLVDDMIEVSVRTRWGQWIANSCAIMPPIDAPTTWARPILRKSSRPIASAAMSLSR